MPRDAPVTNADRRRDSLLRAAWARWPETNVLHDLIAVSAEGSPDSCQPIASKAAACAYTVPPTIAPVGVYPCVCTVAAEALADAHASTDRSAAKCEGHSFGAVSRARGRRRLVSRSRTGPLEIRRSERSVGDDHPDEEDCGCHGQAADDRCRRAASARDAGGSERRVTEASSPSAAVSASRPARARSGPDSMTEPGGSRWSSPAS